MRPHSAERSGVSNVSTDYIYNMQIKLMEYFSALLKLMWDQ